MANYICILSICLVFAALTQFIVADTSTLERIKKHQEWLNRHKLRAEKVKYTKWKSSFEPAKLWRINKEPSNQNSSINEVFTENETSSINSNVIGDANIDVLPTILTQTPHLSSLDSHEVLNKTKSTEISKIWTTVAPTLATKSLIADEPDVLTTALTLPKLKDVPSTASTTTTTTSRKPKPKLRPFPRWTNWNPWSECSRSCGGGVMYQTRKCIDR
ncbi:hypothetical protein AWZ03_006299 [Drosophila navojoa]|nr:hypothetical protein AWZ03_006299 [Drosophila navojoa]